MGVLIETQFRALSPGLWIWTLLACAEVVLWSRGSTSIFQGAPHASIAIVALAAALGARSLTFEATSGTGAWSRSLPLSRRRRIAFQLGFALSCLVASVALVTLFRIVGTKAGWFPAADVEPRWSEWWFLAGAASFAFVASAYFASSF